MAASRARPPPRQIMHNTMEAVQCSCLLQLPWHCSLNLTGTEAAYIGPSVITVAQCGPPGLWTGWLQCFLQVATLLLKNIKFPASTE